MVDDGGGHVCEPVAYARRGSCVGGSAVRAGALRAAVVSIAAVLARAGCTGTASPAPSPPGTPGPGVPSGPTTTPSPSTAPIAPPARPTAMDRHDADGAIAAATYFIALYPYVYATGDLAAWKAMSDSACIFCASVTGNVDEMIALEHSSEGPSITVESARNVPTAEEAGSFAIELRVEQGPSIERDKAGVIVDRAANTTSLLMVVALKRSGVDWSVQEVQADGEGTVG